jgi:ABC-type transport system substrate-binding protein
VASSPQWVEAGAASTIAKRARALSHHGVKHGEKWYITRRSSSGRTVGMSWRELAAATGLLLSVFLVAPTIEAAADPRKIIHWYFPTGETGFDPCRVSDLYSATVDEAIFERLLTYDYLARPAKLVPMVAESMPEVGDNGKTYTFRLRKGIYFTPDPAFKGVRRELIAQDFVYSYMRFVDPANHSAYGFLLDGKLAGLDELAAEAKRTGRFNYDARISGLEAIDRYTVRFRLKETDYNFPYIVAHTSLGAVAREVIEAYGEDTMAHPVGTGPYVLKSWTPRAKIILEANPGYRGFVWDFQPSDEAWDRELIRVMKGKQMPQVGRVEIVIIEEAQSRWLSFQQKGLDYINVPETFAPDALDGGQLKPSFVREGVSLYRTNDLDMTYTAFNMKDPVIGGLSKEKIALRRAMAMAYNVDKEIEVIRKGQAMHLEMPVPAGVVGHDPQYRSLIRYDPELANKLLDYFGYQRGKDGWRTLPDGKPLTVRLATEPSSTNRELDELWQQSLERIGVHMESAVAPFADNRKAAKACKLQMWGQGWIADYPDADNFVQNFYGPNIGQSNNGCYESKAFDKFYEQSTALPNSPERNRLFLLMTRQMEVDGAQSLNVSRMRNELIRPWIKGFKKHPILQADFLYLDVDPIVH